MAESFVKALEIWLPSEDGTLLEFGGGLFGAARSFAALSRQMCFGRGEGLPGQAWDEGRPVLLKQFAGTHFQRIAAAEAAGLMAGLAVPLFRDDALLAVMLLFFGRKAATSGAVEVWHNDPRVTGDLTLEDGFFGGAAESALEPITRDTYLPRGAGLPGLAWQHEASVFMPDLAMDHHFLRGDDARQAGLNQGLAWPSAATDGRSHVLNFLATADCPTFGSLTAWEALAGKGAPLNLRYQLPQVGDVAGDRALAERVRSLGRPEVRPEEGPEGVGGRLAWPLYADGRVAEVLVMGLTP